MLLEKVIQLNFAEHSFQRPVTGIIMFLFIMFTNESIATVYTRVQVECVYKSNPIFEAKNTAFLEKV